tara:strand:- start:235 stop:699 length:465 start_codon:yes stop_codon:yes gene_type:complete
MFNVILYNPQIPPNTGNIIRLSANTGINLHLIRPLGFHINEKSYRRAALDYGEMSNLIIHDDFDNCMKEIKSKNIYAVTKFGEKNFAEVNYKKGDTFVFGSETAGLPKEILNSFPLDRRLFIPMVKGSRSLNLSNAVSVIIYESWRQINYKGSE